MTDKMAVVISVVVVMFLVLAIVCANTNITITNPLF